MAKKAKKPDSIRYTGNARVRIDGYGKFIRNGDTVSHTAVSGAVFEYLESRGDFEPAVVPPVVDDEPEPKPEPIDEKKDEEV